MTSEPHDPLEAGLAIARALEQAGIPYALGGALAYGIWGVARGTKDVDVNVFVTDDRLPEVAAALAPLGVHVDVASATAASRSEGLFVVWWDRLRLDIFTPSIDFSWEAMRTSVRVATSDGEATFLSAEALCVFKLLFFRTKDIADLERVIGTRGHDLDVGYVRGWIVEDAPRVTDAAAGRPAIPGRTPATASCHSHLPSAHAPKPQRSARKAGSTRRDSLGGPASLASQRLEQHAELVRRHRRHR